MPKTDRKGSALCIKKIYIIILFLTYKTKAIHYISPLHSPPSPDALTLFHKGEVIDHYNTPTVEEKVNILSSTFWSSENVPQILSIVSSVQYRPLDKESLNLKQHKDRKYKLFI